MEDFAYNYFLKINNNQSDINDNDEIGSDSNASSLEEKLNKNLSFINSI